MTHLPWFRMYHEAVDDEKLRLLAFEDRWHYIALLCCKAQGVLDQGDNRAMLVRKLAVKMGLQVREVDEVLRRLSEVSLIDEDSVQPTGWGKRQYASDSSASRVAKHRNNKKTENKQQLTDVKRYSNAIDTDTDTDTEKEKTFAPLKVLVSLGVEKQVAQDWLAIRKANRKPLTQTGLTPIQRNAAKAGLTLAAAVKISCERGWGGFNPEWLGDEVKTNQFEGAL
jgi:hypothetical protein